MTTVVIRDIGMCSSPQIFLKRPHYLMVQDSDLIIRMHVKCNKDIPYLIWFLNAMIYIGLLVQKLFKGVKSKFCIRTACYP